MTLQDAIKSGKPYKRPNDPHYYLNNGGSIILQRDVLMDDWEIKEYKLTFSLEELTLAIYHHRTYEPGFTIQDSRIIAARIFTGCNYGDINEKYT